MVDIIALIHSVKKRKPIWDRENPFYKNSDHLFNLWTEVGNEVGADVETVKFKWQALRDTFRIHLRKANEDINYLKQQKWKYFDEMIFVKDQIYLGVHRKKYFTFQQSKTEPDVNIDVQDGEDFPGPAELCITEVNEDVKDNKLELQTDLTSLFNNDLYNSLINDSSSSSTTLNLNSNQILRDDNCCFIFSILPQLKCLPADRKSYVRMKIQELILAELGDNKKQK